MTTISDNRNKIIRYAIIGVAILLLLFLIFGNWFKPWLITQLGGYTKQETTSRIDTISIVSDTTKIKYAELLIKVDSLLARKEVKNYVYTYPTTVINSDGSKTTVTHTDTLPLVYSHENPYRDSLIDGKILTVINPIDCKIIAQSLLYTPKFPQYITNTITVKETVTNTLSKEERALIGIGINVNNDNYAGLRAVYQTKNKWQFQGGYDINTNATKNSDIVIDRPKGVVSLSLIKLF